MLRDRSPRGRSRSGAVLIIVLGLSMVLLGLAVSFMMRMRADSEETRLVLAEAQARLMLHAGLMYLQETSRLGWGQETFGWTDVRDGSLGPRPARNCATSGGTGVIPNPSWWNGGWGVYIASPLDTQLPASASRTWPCPGSVLRCPMAVPVQPPFATQIRYAYNPVGFPDGVPRYPDAGWDTAWITAPLGNDPVQRTKPSAGAALLPTASYWPKTWANAIFATDRGATAALDPQPEADTWYDAGYDGSPGQKPDFIQGAIDKNAPATGDWVHIVDSGTGPTKRVQLQVRPGTDNLCWFRIYREVQGDHDGDGSPAYDRVVMYDAKNPTFKNWNVFVIACGVGPTRGYRFWDAAEAGAYETSNGLAANSVSRGQEWASNSNLFISQQDFAAKRTQTRVLWFRAEWSALQGGGYVPEKYAWAGMRIYPRTRASGTTFMTPRPFPGWNATGNIGTLDEQNSDLIINGAAEASYSDGFGYNAPKTYGGNFRWVQRLDHEPTNW